MVSSYKATQEVVSQVPCTTDEEFKAAVSAAKKAFPSWRKTPITKRQRVMLKFQELIRRDMVNILQCSMPLPHIFTDLGQDTILAHMPFSHITTL